MKENTLRKWGKVMPSLVKAAKESKDEEQFFEYLSKTATGIAQNSISSMEGNCALTVLEMLSYEKKSIFELSKEKKIYIETFTNLWEFLKGSAYKEDMKDMLEDLFHILSIMYGYEKRSEFTHNTLIRHMRRWPSGLDKEIRQKREENKERIIELLIDKIEKRAVSGSRYYYPEGYTRIKKKLITEHWWNDFRFQLTMAVKSPSELNHFLGDSLSTRTMRLLNKAKSKGIPFFVTPYYLSLLNIEQKGFDDTAIRSYIIYSESLVETYGNIRAWEREDIIEEGKPNAAGWFLPEGRNIHRRYPEVAIMIPDTRGRSCGGLCASCQRMFDFQSERLNFDFDTLKPKESWDAKLPRLMEYFEKDSQIRDILITGGDALMTRNKPLAKILDNVLNMAIRKKEANRKRPLGEKYAEIQRVRLGSRLPAYLPFRIDEELVDILRDFRKKGMKAGIRQFIIQTHFQTPLEITPEAKRAIKLLLSAGWIITNQLVFNVAASRRGHTARLRQVLNSLGVVTYYTFSVKGFKENHTLFSPSCRSMQEKREEKSLSSLTDKQKEDLINLINSVEDIYYGMKDYMREKQLLFLPTDRNVLNLPAIGKSMTFNLVGITTKGERILRFDHDRTRIHSPVIDGMGDVFIMENRSVASYLRELEAMGEKISDYSSIWGYTTGKTEHQSKIFDYPPFEEGITHVMTNI
jgi:lysine 2,3-aminomutase